MKIFKGLILSLLVIGSQNIAHADVVSLSSNYVAGQTELVTKLNDDRTQLTNGVNNIQGAATGSTQTSGQIKADTVAEENMADDANPRIRTNEGASCADLVTSGLLPSTTTATLVGSVPAGVGYPDGYRVNKASATANTFTAQKWTWIDLDINGSFTFVEQAIDSALPAVTANSLRICRVSTNTVELAAIQDLRTTSCTAGPFSAIADVTGEGTLDDMLATGSPTRQYSPFGTAEDGWLQGLHVSWDTHTTFIVKSGSAYVGGKYRKLSVDATIPQTVDAPSTAVNGLTDGAIAANTTYYVYAVADKDSTDALSISYSTSASAPSGLTNFRAIGRISTSTDSTFSSVDIVQVNNIQATELIQGAMHFNSSGSPFKLYYQYNIDSWADGGVGVYTLTWIKPFKEGIESSGQGKCGVIGTVRTAGDVAGIFKMTSCAQRSGSFAMYTNAGAAAEATECGLIVFGDPQIG